MDVEPAACQIDGCMKRRFARMLCNTHYAAWLESHPEARRPKTIQGRIMAKVYRSGACWLWTGVKSHWGYGRIMIDGKMREVHRVSYVLANGDIPDGMSVDHQCHNRSCVNPSHLRIVSNKQNQENRRGGNHGSVTGILGVCPAAGGRFRAQVCHNGQLFYLGIFETSGLAEAAVVAKRNELYTHNEADRASRAKTNK